MLWLGSMPCSVNCHFQESDKWRLGKKKSAQKFGKKNFATEKLSGDCKGKKGQISYMDNLCKGALVGVADFFLILA